MTSRKHWGDYPPFEAALCELVGLAVGLAVGIVVGHDSGNTGTVVGALVGATLGPVVVRLPRLRREFVTIFDCLEALGLMVGLVVGVVGTRVSKSGWLAGIRFALVGALLGWIGGWVPAFLRDRYRRRRLSKKTTDALRARLHDRDIDIWLPYKLVMDELRKRGEDVRNALPFVVRLLSADGSQERYHGWEILQAFFPDLARTIPEYDPSLGTASCRDKAHSLAL